MPTRRHDRDLLVAIGNNIRSARDSKGWTQAELAEAIKIEPVTLSRYETGARGPSITVLAQMAKVLGLSLSALMPDMGVLPSGKPRPEIARIAHLLEGLDGHDLETAVRVVEAIARVE